MASNFSVKFLLSAETDIGSVRRSAAQIQSGLRNVNANIGLNSSGVQSGLAKINSGARTTASSIRAMQVEAQGLNATLTGTVQLSAQGASSLRNFSEQAGLAARRFTAFSVAAGALVSAVRGIREGVKAAVDFELSMNKVEQVSSETRSSLAGLRNDISKLATSLGVSSAALAESSVTLTQAGLKADQTTEALKALALVDLAPAFDGQKQAAEGLIAAMKQFQLESKQITSTFSSLNAVAAEFAVESSDIVTAIQKAGGAFKISAGDMKTGSDALNEFVALFTSVRATTRESAESIATGLRTVFTRLQRQDTVKALNDLGINLRYTATEAKALGRVDLTDQFVGGYEAVKRLSEGLKGLRETDPRYSQVVEQLGGYRQISRVVPLLQEFKTAQQALNVAQAGQISLMIAAEKRQDTLANKTQRLKEEYLELFRKITDSKAFQGLANSLLNIASGFAGIIDKARPLLPLLLAIAAVKIGTGIGSIVGGFTRAFAAPPGGSVGTSNTKGILRFAKGGLVPGGKGSNQSSSAETSDYTPVSGKKAVFSEYPATGKRKPLARPANDALVQALGILASRGKHYASGGFVPGSGNNDTEPALLMPGEFVLNKQAVARMGVPSLRDLNEGRSRFRIQRYADGSTDPVGKLSVDELRARLIEAEKEFRAHAAPATILADRFNAAEPGKERDELGARLDTLDIAINSAKKNLDQFAVALAKITGRQFGVYDAKPGAQPELLGTYNRLEEANYRHSELVRSRFRDDARVETGEPIQNELGQNAFAPVAHNSSRRLFVGLLPNSSATASAPAAATPVRSVDRLTPEQRELFFGKNGANYDAGIKGVHLSISKNGLQIDPAEAYSRFEEDFAKKIIEGKPENQAGLAKNPQKFAARAGYYAALSAAKNTKRTGNVRSLSVGPEAAETLFAPDSSSDDDKSGSIVGSLDDQKALLRKIAPSITEGLPQKNKDLRDLAVSIGLPAKGPQSIHNLPTEQLRQRVTDRLRAKAEAELNGVELPVETTPPKRGPGRPRKIPEIHGPADNGVVPPGPPLPPAPPTGGSPEDEPTRSGRRARVQLSARERAEARAAQGLGLTVENYRKLYRTQSTGEQRARDTEFAAGNQPEQTFQVQNLLNAKRKGGGFVSDPAREIARASTEFARQSSIARGLGSLDANISNRRPGAFSNDIFRPSTTVSADVLNRFNVGRDYNPLNPLAGDRELRAQEQAAQKQAADRERVLGSLANQRAAEEQKRNDRDARRLKAQADDSARRQIEVPRSLAAQRAREQAKEASLSPRVAVPFGDVETERHYFAAATLGNPGVDRRSTQYEPLISDLITSRQAAFGAGPEDRAALRRARSAQGGDPLAIKEAAIRAFQSGQGSHDILDDVRGKLSANQYGQVLGAAQKAGFSVGLTKFQSDDLDPNKFARGVASPGNYYRSVGQFSLAEFSKNDDGTRTLTGGLLAERAQRTAEERLKSRGGAANLSEGTQALIRSQAATDEETKTRRELISAQKNLLAKLHPDITSLELHRKATEDAEKALSGQAKVSRDVSGKLLGLSETVGRAQAAGIAAPGAGGRIYGLQSRFGDTVTGAREFLTNNRVTRLNERLSHYTQNSGFATSALVLGGIASYGATALEDRAGNAEQQVRFAGGADHFVNNKSAAGGVQGAVVGGAAGFAIAGPLGALAGTIIGGGVGIYNAFKEAEQDIRKAKISNALSDLSDKLTKFANGTADIQTLSGISEDLKTRRKNSEDFAKEESSNSLLYSLFTGESHDQNKYKSLLESNLRKEVGPLLPLVNQGLTKSAEDLASKNTSLDPKVILDLVRKGGAGTNQQLIKETAETNKESVQDVEQRILKAIIGSQNSARVAASNRTARRGEEQQTNTYGRLLLAVQGASDSLGKLQRSASALTDVLDGNISALHVTAHTERLDAGFGRTDASELKPLQILSAATGDNSLLKSGEAANAVGRQLYSILPTIAGKAGVEGQNVTSDVTSSLVKSLGYDSLEKVPAELQKVINTVAAGLDNAQDDGKGIGGIREKLGTDGSKFIEELLGPITNPLKEYGDKIPRLLADNSNRFIDGLTSLYQRLQQIGHLYDNLADLQTANFRQQRQFDAEGSGRRSQALDNVPLADLEYGFNYRQQRLAGVNGAQALSPQYLGQQLAQVRERIGVVDKQQAAFEKSGGKGPEFEASANELLRLRDRAANLQQALKNLADVSQRNAVIQERLQKIEQEREGRLSAAERYATADPNEKARLARGERLVGVAAQRGNLDNFSVQDTRLILESLNNARGVTLTGVKGSPRAEDLRDSLLSNSFGGRFQLPDELKAERQALQKTGLARGKTGEEAIAELIKHQEKGSTDFFNNLKSQQAQFFSDLKRLLSENALTDIRNNISRVQASRGTLLEKAPAYNLLTGVGVKTNAQFGELFQRQGDVESLYAGLTSHRSVMSKYDSALNSIRSIKPEDFEYEDGREGNSPRDFLVKAGLKDNDVEEVLKKYRKEVPLINFGGGDIKDSLLKGIEQQRQSELAPIDASLNTARRNLSGIGGVDVTKIESTLAGPQAQAFIKATRAFNDGSNKIEDFNKKLTDANTKLAELNAKLAEITTSLKTPVGPVAAKALGGPIFRPQGTDIVPAMLTPGEFVVNAKSASANAALLSRINSARGSVSYLANGGPADKLDGFAGLTSFYDPFGQTAQLGVFGLAAESERRRQKNEKVTSGYRRRYEQIGQQLGLGRKANLNVVRAELAKRAGENAAANLVLGAQASNINALSQLNSGIHRAGDEGQKSIAARILGLRQTSLQGRIENDETLQSYVKRQVGRQIVRQAPTRFATGGLVGGTGVGDTVPALLTPGEFVLNRGAVARAGAGNVQRFNDGGLVGGGSASGGGVGISEQATRAMSDLSSTMTKFIQSSAGFSEASQKLVQTLNSFAGNAQALTQALNNIPRTLNMTGQHQVNVVLNGAEVLAKLTPEIQQMIVTQVKGEMNRMFKDKLPDAGITF